MRHTLLILALLTFALAACTLTACSDAPRTSFSSMEVATERAGPFSAEIQDVSGRRIVPRDSAAVCLTSPCLVGGGTLVGEHRAYYVMARFPDGTIALTAPFNAPALADTLVVDGPGLRATFYPAPTAP